MVYNSRMEGPPLLSSGTLLMPQELAGAGGLLRGRWMAAEGSCGHLGHLSESAVWHLACLKRCLKWDAGAVARMIQKGCKIELLSILDISVRDEAGVRFGGERAVQHPDS